MTGETPDELFGFVELAAVTGMSTSTLSTLLHRSRTHRKAGKIVANDIPEPDTYLGASPVWFKGTVERWLDARATGPSSVRVRRVVDPKESIKQGRAVPLEAETTPEPVDETEDSVKTVPPRNKAVAAIGRFRDRAKARYRSINDTEESL